MFNNRVFGAEGGSLFKGFYVTLNRAVNYGVTR